MKFSFTTLGTSSASPVADRFSSAHVLNICGRLFLIDCGEGCQYLLKRYHISVDKISAIFISHTHGDHIFGLFGLLNTMSMRHRSGDLHIYAPESLKPVLDFCNEYFINHKPFQIFFHSVSVSELQVIFENDDMEISAFPLFHGVTTNGYLFREKNVPKRSFAYISDTAYFEKLAQMVKGVDILYHEATFGDELAEKAAKMLHSTAREAATVASKAGVKTLVIGHFSSVYNNPSVLLREAKEVFTETCLAEEGMEFEVPMR